MCHFTIIKMLFIENCAPKSVYFQIKFCCCLTHSLKYLMQRPQSNIFLCGTLFNLIRSINLWCRTHRALFFLYIWYSTFRVVTICSTHTWTTVKPLNNEISKFIMSIIESFPLLWGLIVYKKGKWVSVFHYWEFPS